jgi:hypothetical protein
MAPAMIGVVAIIAMILVTGIPLETFGDELAMEQMIEEQGAGAFFVPIFLFVLILLVIEFWVFVSWHRFIPLEEYRTGWLPKFRVDRIVAYLDKAMLLVLIAAGKAGG